MAASSQLEAFAQILEGIAGYQYGAAQDKASEYTAENLRYAARIEGDRGRDELRSHRRAVRQLVGSQRVRAAAGGVDPDFGAGAPPQYDAQRLGELDAITIQSNTILRQWGLREQARQVRFEGRWAKHAGRVGLTTSLLKAGATMQEG